MATLSRGDHYHEWASLQWHDIEPPFLTAESVISEAGFLLNQVPGATRAVLELLHRGVIAIPFRMQDHSQPLKTLIEKYSDIPMSVADACIVRMAELIDESTVLTLDSDFHLYRKHGRKIIPLIIPEE